MSIPYADLGIGARVQKRLESSQLAQVRLALATGAMSESDKETLGLCVLLAGDEDVVVAKTAKRTLRGWKAKRICDALSRQTHEKILEFIAEFIDSDDIIDDQLFRCVNINSRTAKMVARRCSARVCDEIAKNRQQLLLNPELIFELKKNANCEETSLSRAESFLRMQKALPANWGKEDDSTATGSPPSKAKPRLQMDLEAEIEAALSGKQSPSLLQAQGSFDMFNLEDDSPDQDLGEFSFDFRSTGQSEFSFDLTQTGAPSQSEGEEERVPLEKMIADMSIGHKIKLAFKGNKEIRGILIRDSNKSVAVAVIKSGRCTDGEVAGYASNRNLADDVIREITANKEWVRKYPVKVALIGNPKTPVSVAMGFLSTLHKKDLQGVMNNRNVSSVISTAARKRYKEKYQKG